MTTRTMRPEILNSLFTEVEALKGVGPQVAKMLRKLGIERVVELLAAYERGDLDELLEPEEAVLGSAP